MIKRIAIYILFALGSSLSRSSAIDELEKLDLITAVGTKTLLHVKILEATPAGLRLTHDGGVGTIPYVQLPTDLRKRYEPASPPQRAQPSTAGKGVSPDNEIHQKSNPSAPQSSGKVLERKAWEQFFEPGQPICWRGALSRHVERYD